MDFIPLPVWWIVLLIISVLAGRYLLLAGVSYLLFYRPGIKRLKRFKIQPGPPKDKQIRNELKYSFSTIFIFSGAGILAYFLFINGHTTLYRNINDHSIAWLLVSLVGILFLHDTYFYWTHRLLHTRWFFRKVHTVHHRSVNPTPLAAYAFHPIEALIESLFIFPVILLFPVHIYIFLLFIFLTLLMNVIGHLGFEFIPIKWRQGFFGKWLSSSTHHNLHHQKSRKNFGYYFTIWDRLMRTLQDEAPKPARSGAVMQEIKGEVFLNPEPALPCIKQNEAGLI